MKISHCSECGTPYPNIEDWPRSCQSCETLRWLNPIPVVAVMQPVIVNDVSPDTMRFRHRALVIAKRAIEPCKGEWALIGGFMNVEESVEEAAAREFREETSLELAGVPRIAFTMPVGGRVRHQLMLMTYVDKSLSKEVFDRARPCSENEEIGLFFADDNRQLAFPSHRDAAARFFRGEFA
jgi:8-oxo-dGTP diphosphatase